MNNHSTETRVVNASEVDAAVEEMSSWDPAVPNYQVDKVEAEISSAIHRAAPTGIVDPFADASKNNTPVTLVNFPAWIKVHFPRRLALEVGYNGVALRTSKLLKYLSDDTEAWNSDYYQKLLSVLPRQNSEPPLVESLWATQLGSLTELAQLVKWAESESLLSKGAVAHLRWMNALQRRELLSWGSGDEIHLPFPVDLQPSSGDSQGVCLPVGFALTNLASDLEETDPARANQLRKIVSEYYPDDVLVDVITKSGESFTVYDLVSEKRTSPPVEKFWDEIEGSVNIVNYGPGTDYAADSSKYSYRLFRSWSEDEEICLLLSEQLMLSGRVGRDDD